MNRHMRMTKALRSIYSPKAQRTAQRRLAAAACACCEPMESRLLFNAGGGFAAAGIAGNYYNNGTFSGSPVFSRTDVRIDFTTTSQAPGGGLTAADVGSVGTADPVYGAITANSTWSVMWDANVIPKYTETYTLKEMIGAGDTGKVYFGTGAEGSNPLVLSGSGTQTTAVTLTAGQTYNLEMTYVHNGGSTWQAQLHWSSSGTNPFGEEAIEPATPIGGNLPSPEPLDAAGFGQGNLGASYYLGASGNVTNGSTVVTNVDDIGSLAVGETVQAVFLSGTTTIASISTATDSITLGEASYDTINGAGLAISTTRGPAQDSDGWPENDFFLQFFAGEYDAQNNGVYTVTFTGAAELFGNDGSNYQILSGHSMSGLSTTTITTSSGTHTYYEYGWEMPLADLTYDPTTGTGYNPANNTTTLLIDLTGGYDNLGFASTSRNGYGAAGSTATLSTGAGITNLTIEDPDSKGGTVDFPAGTVYNPAYLNIFSNYSVIRSNESAWDSDQTDATNYQDWTYRPEPSLFDLAANPNAAESGAGQSPWEQEILLCNETGKDLYINLPPSASGMDPAYDANYSNSYIYQLAELIKNGDTVNGVNWPGLLPNLNVYIEYGNEIWNWGTIPQGGAEQNFQSAWVNNTADYQKFIAAGGTFSVQTNLNLASFDNVAGIYTSGTTFSSSGGLDGNGDALPYTSVYNTYWGSTVIGAPNTNDVVAAEGQTVPATQGQYSGLTVLGMGTDGNQNGQSFVVNYTNGSQATFTQTVSSWVNPLTKYSITANMASGSVTLSNVSNIGTLFTGEILTNVPNQSGIPAGDAITTINTGADTVVLSEAATASVTGETLIAYPYTGMVASGSTTVSDIPELTGMYKGETIAAYGIPAGTTIESIGTDSIVLSQAATYSSVTPEGLNDGESIVAAYTSYATHTGATANVDNYVYSFSFPLNSALTIASVTLPNNSNLKVMAMYTTVNNSAYSISPGVITNLSYQDWDVLRTKDASAIFRTVFGNSAMPSSTNGSPNADPRIRPLYEWQYGGGYNGGQGSANSALSTIDNEFSLDANYYLYGGGAGWYAGDSDTTSSVNTLFSDLPALEQGSSLNITDNLLSDVQILQQFGLHDVGYEGGFFFGNIGGTMTTADESATTDPRITPYVTETLDEYEQATASVGGLPIVYEAVEDQYPSDGWAVQDSIYQQTSPYGTLATEPPKLQGYLDAESTLAPSAVPSGWTSTVVGGDSYGTNFNYGVGDGPTPGTGQWTLQSSNTGGDGFAASGTHADEGYYAYTTATGATTITAELTAAASGNWIATGLMMRANPTDPSSPFVLLDEDGYGSNAGTFSMAYRSQESQATTAFAGYTATIPAPGSTPVWMQLVETTVGSNDVFTGYVAQNTNGLPPASWTTISHVTISSTSFSTSSYGVGLAQDSNGVTGATAAFKNVSVTPPLANEWTLNNTLNAYAGGTNMGLFNGGSVSYSTSVPSATSYSDSASLAVTGSGVGALQAPTNINFSASSNYSMSIWFNTSAAEYNGDAEIMGLGEYWTNNGYMAIRLNQDGYLELSEYNSSGEAYFGASTANLPAAGNWINVVASINNANGTAALYVDGKLFASSTSFGIRDGIWFDVGLSDAPVTLGYRYATSWAGNDYTGQLSDAQIYTQALTQQQANSIFMTGVP